MFPRLFEVPEVLEVQVVPSDEVRIVPEKPTTTKVLFPYATALRLFEVPEVCVVQVVPSDEVSKVPAAPTATNETLDVVLLLLVSLFLAQVMTVRLKRDMKIMYKTLFIFFLHQLGGLLFYILSINKFSYDVSVFVVFCGVPFFIILEFPYILFSTRPSECSLSV
jgi:hypothetical protein